jgi:ATP-binding cassette subfamily B protein
MEQKEGSIKNIVIQMLNRVKGWVFLQLFLSSVVAYLRVFEAKQSKVLTNLLVALVGSNAFERLWFQIGIMLCISLLWHLLTRSIEIIWLRFYPLFKKHITDVLTTKMLDQPLAIHEQHLSGSLSARLRKVAFHLPHLVWISAHRITIELLGFFFTLITFFYTQSAFAYGLMAWLGLSLLLFILSSPLILKRSRIAADADVGVDGFLVDLLSNITNVFLFGNREKEKGLIAEQTKRMQHTGQAREWVTIGVYTLQGFFFLAYQAYCLYLLVQYYIQNIVTPGDFGLVMMLNVNMVRSFSRLTESINEIIKDLGAIKEGMQVVVHPNNKPATHTLPPIDVSKGTLVFDHVSFSYIKEKPMLERYSLSIAAGEKVGLVGYSGGGKSTFIKLVLGLYNPTSGRILIDGQDINQVSESSRCKAIGIIPQAPTFFSRSVIDNIRYSNPSASYEEIIAAAKQADAHDFISNLPEGYHTVIGDQGLSLSGGEEQRIAIARAILQDAPILVLDEATSQLDAVTERKIQQKLNQVMEGKTTLVVAHRLTTLLKMDRILVFDQGTIIEDDSHAALYAQEDSRYRQLWREYAHGFLPEK